jgi:hypothetical protein
MGGSWTAGDGSKVGLVANHCTGSEEGGAWTYTAKVGASGTTVTLSDGTLGTVGGSAPDRSIKWSNGITYKEEPPAAESSAAAPCKHICDMSGYWTDESGTLTELVTDAVNFCAGTEEGGAWTYTVTVTATGTKLMLSDGTLGTVGGSAPERSIRWSNGITYTEQPPMPMAESSALALCEDTCDMSGTWKDGTGALTELVTDAASHCKGSEKGGAWTYTVTVTASGATVTLSDGTLGTIGGSAPDRSIKWSNGITYTEQ